MAYPNFGTYKAIVTDNSEFYKRGYIRVRVSAFYDDNIEWDLSKSYDDTEFKSSIKDDIKCKVNQPIGGGNGHGMFSLPQVNSVGVVNFIDGNIKNALWMGSYVNPKFDNDGEFFNANVPNDKLDYEGSGSEGITVDGKQVDFDGGAIIIRQKSTQSGSADKMNWDKNRTENLVLMSKDKLTLTHAAEWKEENNSATPQKFQEISIVTDSNEDSSTYGETTINVTSVNIGNSGIDEFGLVITDGKVTLKAKSAGDKIENLVEVDSSEVLLTSLDTNTKKSSTVSVTPKEVLLNNKDSNVSVTESQINVSSKKLLTLSAEEVRIGGLAQEYVVTASLPFSYRMEDGTVLSASHRVKA
jgi:hypothetical protein